MDALVALGLVVVLILPMGFGAVANQRLMRQTYQRAVVMELIDGELEVLASGDPQRAPVGVREIRMGGYAATNLPSGKFLLTRTDRTCRIEWVPTDTRHAVPFAREIAMKGGAR
ncbi:MAG: hypothetical protein DVB31_04540 [Verrucomicrobia bacterium]|nr:MAG: hypothetical protein DVB31_04540 [Verrucomicrobiota bacterium]